MLVIWNIVLIRLAKASSVDALCRYMMWVNANRE